MRALSLTLFLVLLGCPPPDTDIPDDVPEADARDQAGDASAEADPTDPTAAPADVAAPPADATVTASGLAYKVLRPGTGTARPTAEARVTVQYSGWTTDGEMFDSSYNRAEPASFGLQGVIDGWTEGLQLMVIGEKTRFWIPSELAYDGHPGRPQGMLVFDIELLEIREPPTTPADVAAPPADASTTASGLAYKVLRPGEGAHPTANALVTVHYSGWTTDGEMFDSSVERGQPATFPLGGVIPGWTEGLQLMNPGSSARLWIPSELAYDGHPGRPQGMLVFDVELLSVVEPPADLAAPPDDVQRSAGGVAVKVLEAGTGTTHPGPDDRVTVNYTGWTTDGASFDSSLTRGRPASFSLGRVIPGWSEGLQLMVEGEKARMWIPAELAYADTPEAPQGMLVFDVELLSITPSRH